MFHKQTEIEKAFFKRYGYNAYFLLKKLNGKFEPFTEQGWDLYCRIKDGSYIYDSFQWETAEDFVVRSVNQQIKSEINHLYFRQISREQAVVVCNVLFVSQNTGEKIQICEGIAFSALEYAQEWNKQNTDKPKIILHSTPKKEEI